MSAPVLLVYLAGLFAVVPVADLGGRPAGLLWIAAWACVGRPWSYFETKDR